MKHVWIFILLSSSFLVLLYSLLQFPKLCGMTGTAATESTEFDSIYKLKVTIVPTNKPMIRKVCSSMLSVVDLLAGQMTELG